MVKYQSKEKIKTILFKGLLYLVLLLMYLPLLVLIIFSFTESDQIGIWSGFSFGLYEQLFHNSALMSATLNTLLIGFVSAFCATILGTAGAIGVFYSKKRYRKAVETMTQLPVVNAEIVVALSLAILFKSLNFKYSFTTLLIGHLVLTVAFVYLNVKPKLLQMDPNNYEAALDLGASPMKALFKVVIPDILPGILSGFLISFTLSLDDFVVTQYLKDPAFETISTYIQKILAKHPMPPEVRALSTILFVAVLLFALGLTIYNNNLAKKKIKSRGNR